MAPIVARRFVGCYQTGCYQPSASTGCGKSAASAAKIERSIARSSKRYLLQICHERASIGHASSASPACDIATDAGLQANGVEMCIMRRQAPRLPERDAPLPPEARRGGRAIPKRAYRQTAASTRSISLTMCCRGTASRQRLARTEGIYPRLHPTGWMSAHQARRLKTEPVTMDGRLRNAGVGRWSRAQESAR